MDSPLLVLVDLATKELSEVPVARSPTHELNGGESCCRTDLQRRQLRRCVLPKPGNLLTVQRCLF